MLLRWIIIRKSCTGLMHDMIKSNDANSMEADELWVFVHHWHFCELLLCFVFHFQELGLIFRLISYRLFQTSNHNTFSTWQFLKIIYSGRIGICKLWCDVINWPVKTSLNCEVLPDLWELLRFRIHHSPVRNSLEKILSFEFQTNFVRFYCFCRPNE